MVSSQLSGVESNIEQFKVRNQLSTNLPEQARLTLTNASDIQQQITSQDVQINVVQSIEDHLKGSDQRVVPNAELYKTQHISPLYRNTMHLF